MRSRAHPAHAAHLFARPDRRVEDHLRPVVIQVGGGDDSYPAFVPRVSRALVDHEPLRLDHLPMHGLPRPLAPFLVLDVHQAGDSPGLTSWHYARHTKRSRLVALESHET